MAGIKRKGETTDQHANKKIKQKTASPYVSSKGLRPKASRNVVDAQQASEPSDSDPSEGFDGLSGDEDNDSTSLSDDGREEQLRSSAMKNQKGHTAINGNSPATKASGTVPSSR